VAARRRHRDPRDREWIGGIVSLPVFVTGEGRPYRPQTIVWLEVDGPVRAALAVRPGEALDRATASVQAAIERPMAGIPRAPARIRVASPELAEVMRRSHPAVDVVCAPTPELDAFVAELRARIAADDRGPPSYHAIDPALCAEVAAHSWELASREAYPWPVQTDDDGVTRPAAPDEVAMLEAIARALPLVLDDAPAIVAAAHGEERWARSVTVSTHGRELEVIVRVPPADDERDDDGDRGEGDAGREEAIDDDPLGARQTFARACADSFRGRDVTAASTST
jgi:hypothetical protein